MEYLAIMNPFTLSPLTAICLTFNFLTRLPVPVPTGADGQCPPLAKAVWAFPLVGATVGGIAGLVLIAASALGLNSTTSVLIAIAASIVTTGALHEDGLADVADGFGGGSTIDDKLAIMRDSRIGTYGVVALALSLSLKASLLSSVLGLGLGPATLALVASGAVSRAAIVLVMVFLTPARSDGLSAAAGRPHAAAAWLNGAIAAAITIAVLWPRESLFLEPWAGVAAFAAAMTAAAFIGILAQRQIGGQTGDVLGSVQQAAEISALGAITISISS
jgi:adenosylcobinamide-GDP ribazoletransferase